MRSPISIAIVSLLTVSVLTILATPVVLADVKDADHGGGSECYNCHVQDGDKKNLHNMTSDIAWTNCGACHNEEAELQTSVHAQVGCKGCHSPLHVSFNEPGAGAWLFVNRINTSGTIAYKPESPLTWNMTVFFYDNTNDTTALGADISTWGGEIHWAWTNVSGSAVGISKSTRYLVCMNCHFLTTNPAEAGLTRMIQGRTMIAVPEFSLKLAPHSLAESALREAASETNQLVAFKSDDVRTISGILAGIAISGILAGIAISGILAGIGIIGAVLWRRRS